MISAQYNIGMAASTKGFCVAQQAKAAYSKSINVSKFWHWTKHSNYWCTYMVSLAATKARHNTIVP